MITLDVFPLLILTFLHFSRVGKPVLDKYLGYMLSPEGLTMAPYKVQIIQDWPEPQKVKDIQLFLSFANFYQRFIYGYSEITVPLTCLTQKGTIWNFTDECRSAFEALKKVFTTAPVLTHWIPDTQIMVETDASDYALAMKNKMNKKLSE